MAVDRSPAVAVVALEEEVEVEVVLAAAVVVALEEEVEVEAALVKVSGTLK